MHRRACPSHRMVQVMYKESFEVYRNFVADYTEFHYDRFSEDDFAEAQRWHRNDQLGALYHLRGGDEPGILPIARFKSMTAQVEHYTGELLGMSWCSQTYLGSEYAVTKVVPADACDAIRQLMECGADIVTPGKHGMTPLHVACRNGSMSVLNLLLECGADVSVATPDGVTPLFVAAEIGRSDLVKVLANHGAKIDAANNLGETSLLAAARNGHADAVELLLELGADVGACTLGGVTPMSAASSSGYDAVVALLAKKLPSTM